ncbi:hypothetical protein J6590_020032 [Homalodisca vitripennis]|nr:hypothetical protein J6590_020032 [Homalodisca vitripennis]
MSVKSAWTFPAVRLTVKTRSQSRNEARPEEEFRSLDTVEKNRPSLRVAGQHKVAQSTTARNR